MDDATQTILEVPPSPPAPPSRAPADRPERSPETAPRGRQGEGASEIESASDSQRTGAEWITMLISSLIVLSLIGSTSYFYLTGSTAPVSVEVETHPAEMYQAGGRYYLPVTVRNSGGQTGEEVRVRVTVTDPSGRQETAEFQVQFLAGGGSSRAVVAFKSDPRQGQIEAGVMSYLEP